MANGKLLEPQPIGPNTPLRLDAAARYAFPDGSMSASGLRREAAKGRLVTERIAGKDYTTLHEIERMRELCRTRPKEQGSTSGQHPDREKLPGSSATAHGTSARDLLRANAIRLSKGLPPAS